MIVADDNSRISEPRRGDMIRESPKGEITSQICGYRNASLADNTPSGLAQ